MLLVVGADLRRGSGPYVSGILIPVSRAPLIIHSLSLLNYGSGTGRGRSAVGQLFARIVKRYGGIILCLSLRLTKLHDTIGILQKTQGAKMNRNLTKNRS